MKRICPKNALLLLSFWCFLFSGFALAQSTENQSNQKVNFGYQENRKPKDNVSVNEKPQNEKPQNENAQTKPKNPTDIYQVGIGDVLFINLQNAPKNSTYFTVLNDGTIDYPLAGQLVTVKGLTTEEIEKLLREKIKLYENPQIAVKVREYMSHKITVLGLVEKSGAKFIQREAVPLFVVRAEANVHPAANQVVVKRADKRTEIFKLGDEKYQNVLIYPNDIVEFAVDTAEIVNSAPGRFVFIGGGVVSGGQKNFHNGLTLVQAIFAAGGLKNGNARRAVVRRKNMQGLLIPTLFDLRLIMDGKAPDPVLQAGDIVEVGE